jgi:phospholipid transport system substrate-binding protein
MRISTGMRWAVASLLLLSSFAVAGIEDPQQMVRETGERILSEVTARKADLEADSALIYPLVEDLVLPHFDFRRMSQSALGRYWRDASDAQKEAVTNEFRELLVRTYATALLGYTGQTIQYLPVQYRRDDDKVTIPTRLAASSDAPPIPINYRLRRDDAKWLVYDVVIDGVSLVATYRSQFAAQVRRSGIDGLIGVLAKMNQGIAQ